MSCFSTLLSAMDKLPKTMLKKFEEVDDVSGLIELGKLKDGRMAYIDVDLLNRTRGGKPLVESHIYVSKSDANSKTFEEETQVESDNNVSKSDADGKMAEEEKPNKKQNDYLDDESMLEWEKMSNREEIVKEHIRKTLAVIFQELRGTIVGRIEKTVKVEKKADIIVGILTKLGYNVEKNKSNDETVLCISLF